MEPEQTDPFAGRLEAEKVDCLEQEGWSLSLDGTAFTKMWPDGNQTEIPFEYVRDRSLQGLKEMLASFRGPAGAGVK
jgi:hypothetical protein